MAESAPQMDWDKIREDRKNEGINHALQDGKPEERMTAIRSLNDEELNQMLNQWQQIRQAQGAGDGVRDDVVQLDLLFKQINRRLGELDRPQLLFEKDLL